MHVNEHGFELQYAECILKQELYSFVYPGIIQYGPWFSVVSKIDNFLVILELLWIEDEKANMFYLCFLHGFNSSWVVYTFLNNEASFIDTF